VNLLVEFKIGKLRNRMFLLKTWPLRHVSWRQPDSFRS